MFKAIAVSWMLLVLGFLTGLYVYGAQVWPYQTVKEIERYVQGHSEEKTSLVKKLANDLNLIPWRHLVGTPGVSLQNTSHLHELSGLPLKSRREKPGIFMSERAAKGYRVLYGAFDFEDKLYGAVLLDPKGEVHHVWQTSQEDVEWEHRPDSNVVPHGFEISRDGSILASYDFGSSITKYDYCGRIIWRTEGNFHHSIDFDNDGSFWVWESNGLTHALYLTKINYQTGNVIKRFSLTEVMEANPEIDIFGIRQIDRPEGSKWAEEKGEQWHPNDIEPLPAEFLPYYTGFAAGDLLVSLRSPNLIFVMDPNSLKVKWWRQGLTRRQHDPDWNRRGTISVFNNNMHRGYSTILELNPVNFNYKILVDGRKYNFYSWVWGKHQMLPGGEVLVASASQGRVFEVDPDGDIRFEFINFYSRENEQAMVVSQAKFLPIDFFKELPRCQS